MASLLLRPLFRPQALGLGLGLSLATYHAMHQRPLRLDSRPIGSDGNVFSTNSYSKNARTPIMKGGNLNPGAVRQISSGSIIGKLLLGNGGGVQWMGTKKRNRAMCWFGSEHVLQELGVDIRTFSCWCTGKFHARGKGGKKKLMKSSGHQATVFILSRTTDSRNTSRASTFGPQCRIMLRSRSRSEPRLHWRLSCSSRKD
jgi:hypothetical protein